MKGLGALFTELFTERGSDGKKRGCKQTLLVVNCRVAKRLLANESGACKLAVDGNVNCRQSRANGLFPPESDLVNAIAAEGASRFDNNGKHCRIMSDAKTIDEVSAHRLWNETDRYLDSLARSVRECKRVDEASNFSRWLQFSGVLQILELHGLWYLEQSVVHFLKSLSGRRGIFLL